MAINDGQVLSHELSCVCIGVYAVNYEYKQFLPR